MINCRCGGDNSIGAGAFAVTPCTHCFFLGDSMIQLFTSNKFNFSASGAGKGSTLGS